MAFPSRAVYEPAMASISSRFPQTAGLALLEVDKYEVQGQVLRSKSIRPEPLGETKPLARTKCYYRIVNLSVTQPR